MDSFTVLPVQIFNWASRPQEDFHSLAAAGIIVLLSLLLSLNLLAILIRNYSRKRYKIMSQFQLNHLNGQTAIIRTKDLTISYGKNTAVKMSP